MSDTALTGTMRQIGAACFRIVHRGQRQSIVAKYRLVIGDWQNGETDQASTLAKLKVLLAEAEKEAAE